MQDRPQCITLPSRALDLTDQSFGLLRALYPMAVGHHGVSWLCECDCGRLAVRMAAALRRQSEHQCSACLSELRGGYLETQRERRKQCYLVLWATTGRLYTSKYESTYSAQIKKECVDHDVPFGEEPPDVEDDAYIDPPEERYCTYIEDDTQTLDEIGKCFDLSRERVRQICLSAYSTLSRNSIIKELWYGVPPLRPKPKTVRLCRCRALDSVSPGVLYCRRCGNSWKLPDKQVQRLKTTMWLERVVVIDEPEGGEEEVVDGLRNKVYGR